MTIGIYKLTFPNTESIYIGQSANIEIRYRQHISCLKNRKAAKKLQKAYDTYGIPNFTIIKECAIEELDTIENEYINIFNSVSLGFNTHQVFEGIRISQYGDLNGRSKHTNSQIIQAFFMLISEEDLTHQEISNVTGVSRAMVVDIAIGHSHKWLDQKFPEEYKYLLSLIGRRKARFYYKIKSPDGKIYEVKHASLFGREHGLNSGNLSRLLNGKCKSHKGWTPVIE